MLGVDVYETMASEVVIPVRSGSVRSGSVRSGPVRSAPVRSGLHALPRRRVQARPAILQPALKRAMDILGAGTLLLLAAPAFLLLALLIRADGGSAFYAHERVGRGGRRFGCLKFRSMVVDSQARLAALLAADPEARAEWEATRKLKDDPRVTRTGRFLRATSLDELPQLLNVLRGEMSLVGPRPVVAAELAAHYGAAAEYYLSVRRASPASGRSAAAARPATTRGSRS